MKILRS